MSLSSTSSVSLETAIRVHYGLSQPQLAAYLGVSRGFVAHLEAGRRILPLGLQARLLKLAYWLPPPHGVGPSAPTVPPLPPLEARPPALAPATAPAVQRRYRAAALALLNGSTKLDYWQRQQQDLAQRAWGLAQLPAAFAAADALPGAVPPTAAETAHRTAWLAALTTDLATATRLADRSASAVDCHLLAARLAALRAELAALAAPLAA